MSLCCALLFEIGCRERLALGYPSRGTSPVPLRRVVKNPPPKAHKDPVTAEVFTL
ncbi:Hypothetical protein FKW44_014098 [Caligus rogercresseyi]|uniref:Uncharacterized protein n=1 Tax=Caligus rogercresseyi TaxID=217165 RepID=A0A7T8GZ43_CALRO|nr:Hypothetical protein FKW44_014098 [Caligus rogercresseyi]